MQHAGHLLEDGEEGAGGWRGRVSPSVGKCLGDLDHILPITLKDGLTACVPTTPVNSLAILPCMEEYNGQFYDTKCEFLIVK